MKIRFVIYCREQNNGKTLVGYDFFDSQEDANFYMSQLAGHFWAEIVGKH